MTKDELKTKVGMGFFSCKWIKNDGSTGILKRGILGVYAHNFTQTKSKLSFKEHEDYVLACRVGNGLPSDYRSRFLNINPNTVFEINGRTINE